MYCLVWKEDGMALSISRHASAFPTQMSAKRDIRRTETHTAAKLLDVQQYILLFADLVT